MAVSGVNVELWRCWTLLVQIAYGVFSAWQWECRAPARALWLWAMCSHRLLGVQSHSYLNQSEDLLSLLSTRLGSWIKNSPLSTCNTAEPSPSFSLKWQNSYSWAVGISLLLSLTQKNFLGLRTEFYQVMESAGSCRRVFSQTLFYELANCNLWLS